MQIIYQVIQRLQITEHFSLIQQFLRGEMYNLIHSNLTFKPFWNPHHYSLDINQSVIASKQNCARQQHELKLVENIGSMCIETFENLLKHISSRGVVLNKEVGGRQTLARSQTYIKRA